MPAVAPGQATFHWQFSPPAPRTRDTEIVIITSQLVENPALYSDYEINIAGPTYTPTPTYTPGSPTATPTLVCATTTYDSTDVPQPINDNTTVTSILPIANSGLVNDIDLTNLNITHTYIGDLQISLTSPGGTTVALMVNVCANNDNISNPFAPSLAW